MSNNIVWKDAVSVPEGGKGSGSSNSQDQQEILVLDTGGLIAGEASKLAGLAKKHFTVPEVLSEVRDQRSRYILESLPFDLIVREPSPESMAAVKAFAELSNDLAGLSRTDLKVIALTHSLEIESNGDRFIRSEPVAGRTFCGKIKFFDTLKGFGFVTRDDGQQEEYYFHRSALSKPLMSSQDKLQGRSVHFAIQLGRRDRLAATSLVPRVEKNSVEREGIEKNSVEKNSHLEQNDISEQIDVLEQNDVLEKNETLERTPEKTAVKGSSWAERLGSANQTKVKVPHKRTRPETILRRTVEDPNKGPLPQQQQQQQQQQQSNGVAQSTTPSKVTGSRIMSTNTEVKVHSVLASACDESDGGWIAPSGVDQEQVVASEDISWGTHKVFSSDEQKSDEQKQERKGVACITTDFAMQNVILQMGLRVQSLEGRAIRRIKNWVMKCDACFHIFPDLTKLFCPVCGSDAVAKLSVTIDASGAKKYGYNPNRKLNLRGTIYSIPKPKGGRKHRNLLLREDQLMQGQWRKLAGKKTKTTSIFGEAITETVGLGGRMSKGEDVVVGYGRKNPNARRGRERRGKKKKNNDTWNEFF